MPSLGLGIKRRQGRLNPGDTLEKGHCDTGNKILVNVSVKKTFCLQINPDGGSRKNEESDIEKHSHQLERNCANNPLQRGMW